MPLLSGRIKVIQSIDESIVLFFAGHVRIGFLDSLMVFITYLGNSGAIWLVICAVLLIQKKQRQNGLLLLAGLALCTIINTFVLKNLITRPRPFEVLTQLTLLIPPPSGFSFPSGHAASSFAAAFTLTRSYGRRGAVSYIPAVLIAVSRVYIGVHYPSDIIAGAVIGTVCALLVVRYLRLGETKKSLPD